MDADVQPACGKPRNLRAGRSLREWAHEVGRDELRVEHRQLIDLGKLCEGPAMCVGCTGPPAPASEDLSLTLETFAYGYERRAIRSKRN
jgi:hypothetical protein